MGKAISLYLDNDLIDFMDDVVKALNERFGLSMNRSEFISFMLRQALDSYKTLTASPTYVSIFKYFEDKQKETEEEARKKKPKLRY